MNDIRFHSTINFLYNDQGRTIINLISYYYLPLLAKSVIV